MTDLLASAYDATMRRDDEEMLARAVLSVGLRGQLDDLLAMVAPDDFSTPSLAELWRIAGVLRARNSYCLPNNIRGEAAKSGSRALNVEAAIKTFTGERVVFSECKRAAELVKDAAQRRRLLIAVQHGVQRISDDGEVGTFAEALDVIHQELGALSTSLLDTGEGVLLDEAVRNWWELLRDPTARVVSPTPYGVLNERLVGGGFGSSQLVTIGARPGVGKSVFLNGLLEQAARWSQHLLYYSLEMSQDECMSRVMACGGNVPLRRILDNDLDEVYTQRLQDYSEQIVGAPITIVNEPGVTLSRVRQRAKLQQRAVGLDMVVIDYLQIMGLPSAKDRLAALTELSGGLKRLAMELKVPVVVAAQLRRPENKNDRPNKDMLRECGAIEQDSDIVILLHRDPSDRDSDQIEIIVDKQRNGPTGVVTDFFDGPHVRIGTP
ncbi:replicative DNA helicase [Tsukamurella soli]|uniref:SF4 helicase domain-containing protein n=1 Tax=Tsukamurella soli TaxID=644556 RepID=A0ABP8JJ72_9ACTN